MAKVITFSRTFPAYHPKKGQQTYFVEKFWESYESIESDISKVLTPLVPYIQEYKSSNDFNYTKHGAKNHTIRSGNRWKEGDYFSPRVWSGKPYNSPMITIAPDTLIVKVWDIVVVVKDRHVFLNDVCYTDDSFEFIMSELAKNDGLTADELKQWFNKPMEGQIICWSNLIHY